MVCFLASYLYTARRCDFALKFVINITDFSQIYGIYLKSVLILTLSPLVFFSKIADNKRNYSNSQRSWHFYGGFMKRLLFFGLALLLLSSALFADDAKVMPQRVGRFYLAPSYIFAAKGFDESGKRESISDVYMFNLGMALEFGVTSWITAAVQWTPGVNLSSKVAEPLSALGLTDDGKIAGVGDLFVGAKLQIIGKEAPVKNDNLRLAFAPGVKVPLPGPEFDKELANAQAGDDFTASILDKHTLGIGLRSYFDIIINENFFINLYNEFIYYPMKKDLMEAGLSNPVMFMMIGDPTLEGKVAYGFDCTFELEPVFNYNIGPKTVFGAGLPVNFKLTPEEKYSFSGSVPGVAAAESLFSDKSSYTLSLRPNVSLFFMGWALPMEFKLIYMAPLIGQDAQALNTINFQIRAYFKI